MRKEYLEILQEKFAHHEKQDSIFSFANQLMDFYESNRKHSVLRFKALLEVRSFESMSRIHPDETPHVELFYGMDYLAFLGGVCGDYEEGIGYIIDEPPEELRYPAPKFEEIQNHAGMLQYDIAFLWLCTLWQEIEGYQYGTVVKTLENNSMAAFFFNDFAWDELSAFFDYQDRENKATRVFNRDLTVPEIYKRLKTNSYPVNPYVNKWRKFTSDKETVEIGSWGNSVATRTNGGELTITEQYDLKERLHFEISKCNDWLNAGYTEVDYGHHNEQIHPDAIEFKFHSGIGWYKKELANRLEESSIVELEQLKIVEFYNKDEIVELNSGKEGELIEWLKIAKADVGELLLGIAEKNKGMVQLELSEGGNTDLNMQFADLMKG